MTVNRTGYDDICKGATESSARFPTSDGDQKHAQHTPSSSSTALVSSSPSVSAFTTHRASLIALDIAQRKRREEYEADSIIAATIASYHDIDNYMLPTENDFLNLDGNENVQNENTSTMHNNLIANNNNNNFVLDFDTSSSPSITITNQNEKRPIIRLPSQHQNMRSSSSLSSSKQCLVCTCDSLHIRSRKSLPKRRHSCNSSTTRNYNVGADLLIGSSNINVGSCSSHNAEVSKTRSNASRAYEPDDYRKNILYANRPDDHIVFLSPATSDRFVLSLPCDDDSCSSGYLSSNGGNDNKHDETVDNRTGRILLRPKGIKRSNSDPMISPTTCSDLKFRKGEESHNSFEQQESQEQSSIIPSIPYPPLFLPTTSDEQSDNYNIKETTKHSILEEKNNKTSSDVKGRILLKPTARHNERDSDENKKINFIVKSSADLTMKQPPVCTKITKERSYIPFLPLMSPETEKPTTLQSFSDLSLSNYNKGQDECYNEERKLNSDCNDNRFLQAIQEGTDSYNYTTPTQVKQKFTLSSSHQQHWRRHHQQQQQPLHLNPGSAFCTPDTTYCVDRKKQQ